MKLLSDLHTHTVVSGHAYSTLLENVNFCKNNGIKILGISDHGPSMPGAPHEWYFGNLKVVPREIDGVTIFKGCEANILNTEGELDISEWESQNLDYLIASFHEVVFYPSSKKDNMMAIFNAIDKNPKVQILGHLGNPSYELDYEEIVKYVKEKDIMIEINNSSLLGNSRKGSDVNCTTIAKLCKKHGTKLILTSDSHICYSIGQFQASEKMLKSIDFPEELIMNDPEKLIRHLKHKNLLQDLSLR